MRFLFLFISLTSVFAILDLASSRMFHVRHYTNQNEIQHILKRTVAILGIKSKQRVIQIMPLDTLTSVDTKKVKKRKFEVKSVVGRTKCAVFDGDCFLHDITRVSMVNIFAERENNGRLRIMKIVENGKTLYHINEVTRT